MTQATQTLTGPEVWDVLIPRNRFVGLVGGQRVWLCKGKDENWYKSNHAGPHLWTQLTAEETELIYIPQSSGINANTES